MDTTLLGQVLTALTQGAAGQAGQQAWTALAALATRLLGRDSAEAGAIEAARAGTPAPALLAGLLARRAGDDPGFAGELQAWLADAQVLLAAGHVTSNQVTGEVSGTVIQAGDVFGGINLGGPPRPPNPAA
jgi:hypothetical protein